MLEFYAVLFWLNQQASEHDTSRGSYGFQNYF